MSPWQQPWESCPLLGMALNLSLPSPGLCWKPQSREFRSRRKKDCCPGLRILGLPRELPTTHHPGFIMELRSALVCSKDQCMTTGGASHQGFCSVGFLSIAWPGLEPSGPALLSSPLQDCPPELLQGQGLRANPGCTTPTVLIACAPAKPQLPLQLLLPTVAPSPFQVLPNPQPFFQSAIANWQPLAL